MDKKLNLPTKQNLVTINCQIDAELMENIRAATKQRKITIRQAVEYGLQRFLEDVAKDSDVSQNAR
jgi:predicted membrane GTPase involved in stress response